MGRRAACRIRGEWADVGGYCRGAAGFATATRRRSFRTNRSRGGPDAEDAGGRSRDFGGIEGETFLASELGFRNQVGWSACDRRDQRWTDEVVGALGARCHGRVSGIQGPGGEVSPEKCARGRGNRHARKRWEEQFS